MLAPFCGIKLTPLCSTFGPEMPKAATASKQVDKAEEEREFLSYFGGPEPLGLHSLMVQFTFDGHSTPYIVTHAEHEAWERKQGHLFVTFRDRFYSFYTVGFCGGDWTARTVDELLKRKREFGITLNGGANELIQPVVFREAYAYLLAARPNQSPAPLVTNFYAATQNLQTSCFASSCSSATQATS